MEAYFTRIDTLANTTKDLGKVYQPSFYRLLNENDRRELNALIETPGILVFDELEGQLMELVKSKNPTIQFKQEDLKSAAREYLGNTPAEEYGVWVHYPWLNRIVHILDSEEYREVRTNRNQFKITPEERNILGQQKIGILGLSVGQAVAIALSMERGYGELRIADYDTLELSNLNRIRSGVQDLGLLKTVSTARQIAEIDPFLKVKAFHEGVTEENLDQFFTQGGKLDLLIDECDGLDIKILARHKAKQLKVPVVMETSDRGMLDVERFDLESDRPIFHGLIDHLDLNPQNLKGLSNEEKIPYILPIVGIDTMSDRLKASMLEIEQSITTWPQLASDVILGGAVSAIVCRRIALNQFKSSGRFFVDVNQIVHEENTHKFLKEEERNDDELTKQVQQKWAIKKAQVDDVQVDLEDSNIENLVEAAIWAPSGGNSQPWHWIYEDKNLYLLMDKSRAESFLDYASAGSFLSLGAATENLVLKAHEMGVETSIDYFPDKSNLNLTSVFRFFPKGKNAQRSLEKHDFDDLASTIGTRLTNRLIREHQEISPEKLASLKAICGSVSGAGLTLIDNDQRMTELGELIAKVDRILITHKEGHYGFVNEIRWNDTEAAHTKDGVDIATVDLSAGEATGFRMAKNWSVVKTLNNWGGGSVFEKLSRKCVAGASALGVLTMDGTSSEHYFNAGRALERVWLSANQKDIAFQPMTALTFLLHRLTTGNGVGLTASNIDQLNAIKGRFMELCQISGQHHPVFLFRLLKAENPKVKSQRRPVTEVLEIKR